MQIKTDTGNVELIYGKDKPKTVKLSIVVILVI